MPRYVLLLHEDANPPIQDLSPSDLKAVYDRYKGWADRLEKAGRLVGGNKLADGSGRLLVRNAATQGVVVKDGPYAETNEVLGGYFMIEARDYDEAVKLASDCPHLDWFGGKVEIRQVDECPAARLEAETTAAAAGRA